MNNLKFTRNKTYNVVKMHFKNEKDINFEKVANEIWDRFKKNSGCILGKESKEEFKTFEDRSFIKIPEKDDEFLILEEKHIPYTKRLDSTKHQKHKADYRRALKIVTEHIKENKGTLDPKTNFCLQMLIAQLYSQLGDHEAARVSYNNAEKCLLSNKEQILDLKTEKLSDILEKEYFLQKSIKHQPLRKMPDKETALKRPEVVLANSVYSNETITEEQIKQLEAFFYEMKTRDPVVEALFKWYALDALSDFKHPRFIISPSKKTYGGFYNRSNTIHINAESVNDMLLKDAQNKNKVHPDPKSQYRKTICHEITHKTLQEIFHNRALPYLRGDATTRKAYQVAIKKALMKGINDIIPLEDLKNMEPGKIHLYTFKKPPIPPFQPEEKVQIKICFPVAWKEDMSLADIFKNLSHTYEVPETYKSPVMLAQVLGDLGNTLAISYEMSQSQGVENISPKDVQTFKTASLFMYLTTQLLNYPPQYYQIESITHYLQYLGDSKSSYKEIFNKGTPFYPILSFFKRSVLPEIEKELLERNS